MVQAPTLCQAQGNVPTRQCRGSVCPHVALYKRDTCVVCICSRTYEVKFCSSKSYHLSEKRETFRIEGEVWVKPQTQKRGWRTRALCKGFHGLSDSIASPTSEFADPSEMVPGLQRIHATQERGFCCWVVSSLKAGHIAWAASAFSIDSGQVLDTCQGSINVVIGGGAGPMIYLSHAKI